MYLTKSIIRNYASLETNRKTALDKVTKTWSPGRPHIFLSHSHADLHDFSAEDYKALLIMLLAISEGVYIDSLDPEMPALTSEDTASRLKEKIDGCDRLLMAATNNAVNSRWVPWEVGYADKAKSVNNVVVIPIADPSGQWEGSEYLRLYPQILITDSNQLGVFPPSKTKGVLMKHWMITGNL